MNLLAEPRAEVLEQGALRGGRDDIPGPLAAACRRRRTRFSGPRPLKFVGRCRYGGGRLGANSGHVYATPPELRHGKVQKKDEMPEGGSTAVVKSSFSQTIAEAFSSIVVKFSYNVEEPVINTEPHNPGIQQTLDPSRISRRVWVIYVAHLKKSVIAVVFVRRQIDWTRGTMAVETARCDTSRITNNRRRCVGVRARLGLIDSQYMASKHASRTHPAGYLACCTLRG